MDIYELCFYQFTKQTRQKRKGILCQLSIDHIYQTWAITALSVIHPLTIIALKSASQDRIEKIVESIDNLNPFDEKKIFLNIHNLESINLIFDPEGRIISKKLLNHEN